MDTSKRAETVFFPLLSEMCDDGNNEDGDGCSRECTIEALWDCTVYPTGESTENFNLGLTHKLASPISFLKLAIVVVIVNHSMHSASFKSILDSFCVLLFECLGRLMECADLKSSCRKMCGNGLVNFEFNEKCDDFNVQNLDGCSAV
jgi:cysteine-rich repeat protein